MVIRAWALPAVATVLAVLPAANLPAAETIRWREDADQAIQQARREARPVLIHFSMDGCAPCRLMEMHTLPDPDVVVASRGLVMIHATAEAHPHLVARYGVNGFPSDVVLGPDGKVLESRRGNTTAPKYAAFIRRSVRIAAADDPEAMRKQLDAEAETARVADANGQAGGGLTTTRKAPLGPQQTTLDGLPPWMVEAARPPGMAPPAPAAAAEVPPATATAEAPGPTPGRPQGGPLSQAAPDLAGPPSVAGGEAWSAELTADPTAGAFAAETLAHPATAASSPWDPAPGAAPAVASTSPSPSTEIGPGPGPGLPGLDGSSWPEAGGPSATWDDVTASASAAGTARVDAPPGTPVRLVKHERTGEPTPPPAMHGCCCVTLLTEAEWLGGDPTIGAWHRGRLYLFASAAKRDLFLADPDKFAPALGGYDIVQYVDQGRWVEGDGTFGTVDPKDRMFFFLDEQSQAAFEADSEAGGAGKYLQAFERIMSGSGS